MFVISEKCRIFAVKISYGLPNRSTICVSFHIAEYPMKYPYKKKGGTL